MPLFFQLRTRNNVSVDISISDSTGPQAARYITQQVGGLGIGNRGETMDAEGCIRDCLISESVRQYGGIYLTIYELPDVACNCCRARFLPPLIIMVPSCCHRSANILQWRPLLWSWRHTSRLRGSMMLRQVVCPATASATWSLHTSRRSLRWETDYVTEVGYDNMK